MALVPDQKFSTFNNGGDLEVGDVIVGLRGGLNTRFSYTGELPTGVIIPIINGGTGANNVVDARFNLGLGSMALQDYSAVSITGGTADLASGTVATVAGNPTDITNVAFVQALVGTAVQTVNGTLNRITSTGGVNPAIDISASYVGQASITTLGVVTTGTWNGTTVAIANGGTGVTSVTTSPTAGAFAGWDSNKNLSADNFIPGFTSTVSAAGNTILTVDSTYIQEITGATTQTITLPVVAAGHPFFVINNSAGNVTVNSSGGNAVQVMAANTSMIITCVISSGTTAAAWNGTYVFDNGAGVISITGTANQVNASASTGAVTLSLSSTLNLPGTFNIQSTTAVSAIINDGTMATASATNLPTALSVKTYADQVGGFRSVQVFSASGTWNRPTGIKKVLAYAIGGGGGGGYAAAAASEAMVGSGGGGGALGISLIDVTAISSVTVTIGAAGVGGIASSLTSATAGGTTTFGAHITAPGGAAGNQTNSGTTQSMISGGTGAALATGGTIVNLGGEPGSPSTRLANNIYAAGNGGNSMFGSGGFAIATGAGSFAAGGSGIGFGSGGGGGARRDAANANGGAGSGGLIIVYEYA